MNPSPLVSVLMPAYNAEKFVKEAIDSIVAQSHNNWELLVLNDASTDRTYEIISGFNDSRIKIFQHSENQGYLLSCNELFEKAEGEFITFLDADDTCTENRLSLCLQEFRDNPELDFLTTDHQRMSESGSVISRNSVDVDYEKYAKDPNYNPTICCATIFVRRDLVQKVGGYRDFFKEIGGEDYFCLWELSQVGKGEHVNNSLYSYRRHELQTSRNHGNELYLFLPELLSSLRNHFQHTQWSELASLELLSKIKNGPVSSKFEVSLRKAQFSINNPDAPFNLSAFRALRQARNIRHVKSFAYLLYSWLIRLAFNKKPRQFE